jgi:hypothetical protein
MDNGFDAFVYHPIGTDPGYYTNRDQTLGWDSGSSKPIFAQAPNTTTTTNKTMGTSLPSRYEQRRVRSDGSIGIPKSVLSTLGKLSWGDKVYGYYDDTSGEIVLTSKKPHHQDDFRSFFVYLKGGARVPKRLINKYWPNQGKFRLIATGGELRIIDC